MKNLNPSIKNGCRRIDFWFYGRENEDFIYYEDTFFGLKNQILLRHLIGKKEAELWFSKSCLWIDRFYPPRSRGSIENIVEVIRKIKMIERGETYIHAACVEKDGEGILMAAFPNVGKTLSCLQLMKAGWRYLSDDTIRIDQGGWAHFTSFPSAIGYRDFLKFVNPSDIGKWKYISNLLKAKLYESNKGLQKIFKPPLICLGDLTHKREKTKIKTVLVLDIGPERIEPLDKDQMLDKIKKINSYCLPDLNNPLILAYSYFNDSFSIASIKKKEVEIISSFLNECKEFYALSCKDWNWIEMFKKGGIL